MRDGHLHKKKPKGKREKKKKKKMYKKNKFVFMQLNNPYTEKKKLPTLDKYKGGQYAHLSLSLVCIHFFLSGISIDSR